MKLKYHVLVSGRKTLFRLCCVDEATVGNKTNRNIFCLTRPHTGTPSVFSLYTGLNRIKNWCYSSGISVKHAFNVLIWLCDRCKATHTQNIWLVVFGCSLWVWEESFSFTVEPSNISIPPSNLQAITTFTNYELINHNYYLVWNKLF